uniref:Ubiquitin carboxyl-terminal hydrolase 37 n=1 Tax=Ciona intestinalis TaxID=7719 RepID=F7AGZ7_CIOIN|nr:ubiquitin carboxyl-terminal hydrolase 37 [Ciona intestinalis]|eukprot:XP_002127688.1 ubiquitin carboxyl-terminal hydrolase 37 [Ciona intestinalis]
MKRRRNFDNCRSPSPESRRRQPTTNTYQITPTTLSSKSLKDFRKAKSELRVSPRSPNEDGKENTSPEAQWNKTLNKHSFYGSQQSPSHEMNNNPPTITPNKYRTLTPVKPSSVRRSLSLGNPKPEVVDTKKPTSSFNDGNNNNESAKEFVKPLGDSGNLLSTNHYGGFQNLGNTCYMNSVLQSLFRIPPFQHDLLYVKGKLNSRLYQDSLLVSMVNLMKHSGNSCLEKGVLLRKFKRAISSNALQFNGYAQHDAHEFLRLCLDVVQANVTQANKEMMEVVDCPVVSNFSFKVKQQVTCVRCKSSSNTEEEFLDLPIDLQHRENNNSVMSLQNLVDLSFGLEEVEHKCDKCGHDKANVGRKISKLPRVMMMYLKRYSYNHTSDVSEKLRERVHLPSFISFGHLCCSDVTVTVPQKYKDINDIINGNNDSVEMMGHTNNNNNNNNNNNEPEKLLTFNYEDSECNNNNNTPGGEMIGDEEEREKFELERAIQLSRDQYFNEHKTDEDVSTKLTEDQQMILAMQLSMQESFDDNDSQEDMADLTCSNESDLIGQSNCKGELPHSYHVVSIVSHKGGSSKSGHYVSDVLNPSGDWKCYNDEFVETINEKDVLFGRQSSAYLLFYVHKDVFCSTMNSHLVS